MSNEFRDMSFIQWLGLIFITLKLTNQIDWKWIWVLSPIISDLLFYLIMGGIEKYKEGKKDYPDGI